MPDNTLLPRAIVFAIERHGDQLYGDRAYAAHLQDVAAILTAAAIRDDEVLAAAWLHDVLEDTPTTFVELMGRFGANVANMVGACTGHGKDRAARMTAIYWKLTQCPQAVPIKVADRLANITECLRSGNADKGRMYLAEADQFWRVVEPHCPPDMMFALASATAFLKGIV